MMRRKNVPAILRAEHEAGEFQIGLHFSRGKPLSDVKNIQFSAGNSAVLCLKFDLFL